jgi:hypothetical protein
LGDAYCGGESAWLHWNEGTSQRLSAMSYIKKMRQFICVLSSCCEAPVLKLPGGFLPADTSQVVENVKCHTRPQNQMLPHPLAPTVPYKSYTLIIVGLLQY